MDKKQLEELIEKGLTVEEISYQLDIKISQVRFWCGKFNLTIKFKRKCCFVCKTIKDISNFHLKESKKSYSSYCSNCLQKQSKIKRKTKGHKQDFVDYKGGSCEVCGYDKCLSALEFHHKDPSKKDFGITEYKSKNLNEEIKQELDKCSLLCANCHREEHNKIYNNKINYNFLKQICPSKYCKNCDITKPLTEFYFCNNKRKGIKEYYSYCKQCLIDRTLNIQKRLKREAVEYKGNKCCVCDYDKLDSTLEFHHLDPFQKDFNLASKIKSIGYLTKEIKEELDKCILVCANCHREVHSGIINISKKHLLLDNKNYNFSVNSKISSKKNKNNSTKTCSFCFKSFFTKNAYNKKYCSDNCYYMISE